MNKQKIRLEIIHKNIISMCSVLYLDFQNTLYLILNFLLFVWVCINTHSLNCALPAREADSCEFSSDQIQVCVSASLLQHCLPAICVYTFNSNNRKYKSRKTPTMSTYVHYIFPIYVHISVSSSPFVCDVSTTVSIANSKLQYIKFLDTLNLTNVSKYSP